jgi:hypothetical protein
LLDPDIFGVGQNLFERMCGGDARAAVRVLLVANAYLEQENERLQQAVSAGFSRRKIRPRAKPKEPDKQLDL